MGPWLQLTGEDGVRIWHDQTLIKEAWANPTAMHIDNPNWGYSSHGATSIWVALDDATEANGCLYFIRGSHKDGEHSHGP
jgi:ectoine hydroxylase-related dioxygenase (phytanoyl-CoA dioxygenase family)